MRRIKSLKFMFDGMEKLLNGVVLEFKGKALEYYDMDEKLFDLMIHEPYSVGRFVGYIRRGVLIPSFQLMQEYVDKFDRDYIIVNDKTSELFTYGRDIFPSSVILDRSSKDYVIVCNRNKEVLGLAKKGKRLIKNVVDIGLFVRKFK